MRTLLAALVLLATSASAFEVKRDSTGEPASWKSAVHFVLDADLDAKLAAPGATDAVRAALQHLNQAAPTLSIDAKAGAPHGVGYDFDHPEQSTSDILAPAKWEWNVDAVATTVVTISKSTHQIIEADIAFNVQHTQFAVVAGAAEGSQYDVQNAMTHELGHAFGLAHNSLPESVMYPSSHPGEISKRAFAADDREGLKFLYGAKEPGLPVEPTQGCSATTAAPAALAMMMVVVLLRRRRAVAAVAGILAVLFVVEPVSATIRSDAPWEVTKVTTLAPMPGQRILESEVTFTRGDEVTVVKMRGGRWGDLEQIVDGVSVPVGGERADHAGFFH